MNQQEAMNLLPKYFDSLMEQSTAQRPAWNMEMIRSGNANVWSYVDACMLKAALALYDITKRQHYLEFADSFLDWYVQENGEIKTYDKAELNIDNICPAKNLFELYAYTGKEKWRRALDHVREQLDIMPRTKAGNFWHKNIYPWQVWLDGLYMGQPFYLQYELAFKNGAGCEDSFMQFRNVYELMRKENGLYYHGYDESRQMYWADKQSGCSPHCWGRAVGWLMAALADTLEVVENSAVSAENVLFLEKMAVELADALIPWQHQDGMFYQVVDMPEAEGNYLEASGTLLMAYGIMKCVRLGKLPQRYWKMAESAFAGTVERYLRTDEHGQMHLHGICLVAGLGGAQRRDGSLEYYFSEPIVQDEGKGVAPLLLCYTELLRKTLA